MGEMTWSSWSSHQAAEVDEGGGQVFGGAEGLGRAGAPTEGPSSPHHFTPALILSHTSRSFLCTAF